MPQEVKFAFAIGEKVTIAETGRPATVVGLWLYEESQPKYAVRYADQTGAVNETWLPASALEPTEPG